MPVMTNHPLAQIIAAAAARRPPAADGGWERVPPWRAGVEGVFAFTGHGVLAVGDEVSDEHLAALGVDGLGGAHHPRVLLDLAGPTGWIDSLDALLVTQAVPGGPEPLVDRPDLAAHPRAVWARAIRDDVRVVGSPDRSDGSLATLSRGVGGLTEISVELAPEQRGQGRGSALVRSALAAVAVTTPDAVVVAAVAPGNVASLRAFLAAGFEVVGSMQLVRPGNRRTALLSRPSGPRG
jgi:GNAT superfamily N-acetyltransferase